MGKIKLTRLLLVVVLAGAMGGCLSQQESNTSTTTGNNNQTQNSAPVISGTPASSVVTGDTYSFTPSATDADGDTLSFSIDNKPSWATFEASTGKLSGQPMLGDEGTYADIGIHVTDGEATASLPAFSIEVTQTALGSMTLNWTPPTENEDGSALTDLAGYKLYYGTSSGNYSHQVNINNAGISTYVIDNLVPDTYYVVATARNSAGVESAYSNEAVKTVTAM